MRVLNTDFIGQTGIEPRIIKLKTTDSYATVTTAGYLNQFKALGYSFNANDLLAMSYGAGTSQLFSLSIDSDGIITIVPPVNAGNVIAGGNGIAGYLASFPATASKGSLRVTAVANTGNTVTTISNSAMGQASTISIPDPGASTANFLLSAVAAGQTAASSTASATPGTIRALRGAMTTTQAITTSGNLVGARGEVNMVGASGGFFYGAQGKIITTGTLSGSSWTAGVFGQLDISAATINAGQTAALWGDYGTTSGTLTDPSGMRGIVMTNTTAAVLNAQDYRYGNATYLMELAGAGGTLNYYLAAGTSGGSAGDSTHCAAQQVLRVVINGVAAYIPVFTQNT